MELNDKLAILSDAAKYDASCASSGSQRERPLDGLGNTQKVGICHSFTPDGRCVALLKLLMTNYCIYDCSYCVNRLSSDVQRAAFTPDEVVSLTMDFYKRNYIEGLFLSSGILQTPDYTMELLASVAKRLRIDHKFGGYIHLKAAPGASQKALSEAGRWADRLSVNIELPTQSDLNKLAPAKKHEAIESTMQIIKTGIQESKEDKSKRALSFSPSGQSTQMIVGATATTDSEILVKASSLYKNYRLKRVYYSAFSPIPHADPLLPVTEAPLVREHRLYQADWLLRFYGFKVEEITSHNKNLSLERDPKHEWALRNPAFFPIDVNRSPREMLLRIPGMGVRNVERVLSIRRYHKIGLADLKKLRVSIKKVSPFIITVDHNPRLTLKFDNHNTKQLDFFDSMLAAQTGEL